MNTDTPLPPEEPAGQNPPDGAIIDYFLKEGARGPVTLEILDAAGGLVRRYSSADPVEPVRDEANVPAYWIRPPRVLSRRAGHAPLRLGPALRAAPPGCGALSDDGDLPRHAARADRRRGSCRATIPCG